MGGPPMRTSRTPRWSFLLAVLASQIHTPTLASSSSRAFPCGPIPPTRATRSSCRRSSNRRPRATSSMRRSGSGRRRSFRVRKAGDHGGLPGRADPRGQLLPDREELRHAPGLAYDGFGIYAWDATAPAMLFMRTFALWWALDGTLQSYVPGPDLAIDVIRGDVENVLQLAGYFDLAFFGPAVCLAGRSMGGAVAEPDDPRRATPSSTSPASSTPSTARVRTAAPRTDSDGSTRATPAPEAPRAPAGAIFLVQSPGPDVSCAPGGRTARHGAVLMGRGPWRTSTCATRSMDRSASTRSGRSWSSI